MDTSLAKKIVVFCKKKLCSKFHNEDQLYVNCLLYFPITYCQHFPFQCLSLGIHVQIPILTKVQTNGSLPEKGHILLKNTFMKLNF